MEKVKNLVVGAGLSGAVIAERIASQLQEPVLVIDRREHIAGNIYDSKHSTGITVHRYGPHIFHTGNRQIWDYLSAFTSWHYFFLKVHAWVDNRYVTLPFNLNTLHQAFPEYLAVRLEEKLVNEYGYGVQVPVMKLLRQKDADLQFLARYVYEKVFEQYTLKQWGISPQEIDAEVMARVPILVSRDDGYFRDKYQAIPAQGYTRMVENMLRNPLITVRLKTPFEKIRGDIEYQRLFYTGPIDEFFDYKFGELPYRSLRFDIEQKSMEYYQPSAVTNYPNNFDFTRICEHKYFLNEKGPSTVISVEFPQEFKRGETEPYYPVSNPASEALYQQYAREAEKLPGAYFFGRLGGYKYCNMDQAVSAALALFEKIRPAD